MTTLAWLTLCWPRRGPRPSLRGYALEGNVLLMFGAAPEGDGNWAMEHASLWPYADPVAAQEWALTDMHGREGAGILILVTPVTEIPGVTLVGQYSAMRCAEEVLERLEPVRGNWERALRVIHTRILRTGA
jgi:hypothetical protein